MSQENIEAIRKGMEAINRGDVDAAVDLAHPDFEWQTELIGTPTYRGLDGAKQGLTDVTTAWESWQMEPVELLDRGDQVAATVRVTARGRTTGAPVQAEVFYAFDFRDGKVVRLRGFTERAQALEAAGLSE